jgi:hypothetical protein
MTLTLCLKKVERALVQSLNLARPHILLSRFLDPMAIRNR